MRYLVKQNKADSYMVEFYFTSAGKQHLACVMHEDCIEDANILAALRDSGEAEIELSLVP